MNGPVDPQSTESKPTPRGSRRPRRRSTSGRIFRFLGWATVLALALGAGAKPAYRLAKGWNARGKAREVESRVAARDFDGTFDLVKSAVRLAPDDPEVLRAAARFLALGRAEESVSYWQKYLAVAGLRADARERSEYVEAALLAPVGPDRPGWHCCQHRGSPLTLRAVRMFTPPLWPRGPFI
jgi:hypothetical protein